MLYIHCFLVVLKIISSMFGITVQAMASICHAMEASRFLLVSATGMVEDILNTIGKGAETRLGWATDGNKRLRRTILPFSGHVRVGARDRSWDELEARVAEASRLVQWFDVPARLESGDEYEYLSPLLTDLLALNFGEEVPGSLEDKEIPEWMGVLKDRCDRVLMVGVTDDELRETILFVIDVFEQVVEFFREVAEPLIRDDLLQAVESQAGSSGHSKYLLKGADDPLLKDQVLEKFLPFLQEILWLVKGKVERLSKHESERSHGVASDVIDLVDLDESSAASTETEVEDAEDDQKPAAECGDKRKASGSVA